MKRSQLALLTTMAIAASAGVPLTTTPTATVTDGAEILPNAPKTPQEVREVLSRFPKTVNRVPGLTVQESMGISAADYYANNVLLAEPQRIEVVDRAGTLPGGRPFTLRVGGVHLTLAGKTVVVSRYDRVTSLRHASSLGWIVIGEPPAAEAELPDAA